ncbi:MAG: RMD1 family protein [Prochlorothrix sp.]|nr:RMD1 family protein [Prochlorothrix sp.]
MTLSYASPDQLDWTQLSGVKARALLISERIDLRALATTEPLSTTPFTLQAGQAGCAVLFRYGAVVLFNLEPIEEAAFLASLEPFVAQPFSNPKTETVNIQVRTDTPERLESDEIHIQAMSLERLQIIAEILAKSVVLDHYETEIASVFVRIEPMALAIQGEGKKRPRNQDLLRHIGGTLLIQHRMVGLVEIGEKPETLWDLPEFDRLYLRLEEEYELRDRLRALDRKLALISRTAETALELMQHDSSQRVEWYIVSLIVIEILLTLYQLFWEV